MPASMTTSYAGQTCGIYPRVSTRKQSKPGRTSLDNQKRACELYAAKHGMQIDPDCVRGEAHTSTTADRPELNELLRNMKAQHVRNLVIDAVDRLTREDQIASVAKFLIPFIDAGIVLHVVKMNLVVNTPKGVNDFLNAVYQAWMDNQRRRMKTVEGKRSRAQYLGIFIRGNRAVYGFRWMASAWDDELNVTEKRLEPDIRPFVERGWPTIFAPTPYAVRVKIIRMYGEEGWSLQQIADQLNADHVPTATMLLKRENASPT